VHASTIDTNTRQIQSEGIYKSPKAGGPPQKKEEKAIEKETPKIEKPIFGQKAEKVGKEIYDFIDLNARIGLVEKFFKGNSIELSECLMKVNQKNTLNESVDLMNQYAQKYNISELDDIYQTFLDIINRKFQ
jgi:hypothetical protein